MSFKAALQIVIYACCAIAATAQENYRSTVEQCGTMPRLQLYFERNPELKLKFEQQRTEFNKMMQERFLDLNNRALNSNRNVGESDRLVYTIPVVFHIVLPNPASVTDDQVLAQLDTLNKDFFGSNGDTLKVPSYFKSLYGRSGIQFCLAQRTPEGEPTSGIERITTTKTSFSNLTDDVKHVSQGGANLWDNQKYYNVWICTLSNGIVGYASFPDAGQPDDQGVVVDYRALPGGSFAQFNSGKTLTHETGHYFNLYHIWGDDGGACTGTDYIDDTPNQADATKGCYSTVKYDNCTPGGNGIMYENYMDYSNDDCLVMFTNEQVARMENALMVYRSSLLSSDGCQAPVVKNYDIELRTITQPEQRICSNAFFPVVNIRNRGMETLTSLTIQARIDGGDAAIYSWTGSLPRSSAAQVSLPSMSTATGLHTLTIYVSNPNNNTDEDPTNDTLSVNFQYNQAVTSLSESFESTKFLSQGWDIVNPDNQITWKLVTGIAKTGNSSMMIDNFNYASNGQKDDLRFSDISILNVDSAFLSFEVAAASITPPGTANNNWDTLEVLISTDCGQNYTSLYKKYGSSLVTRNGVTSTAFVPSATEWRKDSINLASYIASGPIMVAFRNTSEYENNIYLDDVNLRTVTINKNLKEQGFLVTPNPTTGLIAVQFYPQPVNLRAVEVYNMAGQKISGILTAGQANNYYGLDISRYSAGTYVVRAIFTDKVLVKKIVKY